MHLDHSCFLEHLIERIPKIEQLSVRLENSLINKILPGSDIPTLILSNGNWFNKVSP